MRILTEPSAGTAADIVGGNDDATADPDAVPAGFAELFHGEAGRLVRLAALLGADDPEDIVQEAFCKLLGSWRRVQGTPRPYLQRIVVNAVRSRHRHLRVVRLRTLPPPSPVASAEETVVCRDDHRDVIVALRRLGRRQREAIVLRYWLDLPDIQIAEVMGVSVGTVKSQVSRGLRALEKTVRTRS